MPSQQKWSKLEVIEQYFESARNCQISENVLQNNEEIKNIQKNKTLNNSLSIGLH